MIAEVARHVAEQAIGELQSEQPLVLMSPSHWERLTAAVTVGIVDYLDRYWKDPEVREALMAQYERQQEAYWARHGDDGDRVKARKERQALYRKYNVRVS